MKIERRTPTDEKMMVPRLADREGFVVVDGTWGTIQPLEVALGIHTVAELEVIEHLNAGRPVIDTRGDVYREQATIPGARGIPHEQIVDRVDELDRTQPTVLFCNGPQCAATPEAVRALLEHGYPADKLRYYRGGIHDWMTLGLPVEGSRAAAPESNEDNAS
ncbi:MAG: rhodanese-like domain-containing protein [Actinomycetota bacterium]|nr:rhodanese-like domain-containing protein [Actinomycetota bacterium]